VNDKRDIRPTATQRRPNISTEHQDEGDARRPSDTLDREPKRDLRAERPFLAIITLRQ
jgi:hypothetical protein